MDKTVEHLVGELKKLAQDVTDEELKDVATVSAGGNDKVRLQPGLLHVAGWESRPWPLCAWAAAAKRG